jgi:hypothetical protein
MAPVGQDLTHTPQATHLKGLWTPKTVRMELVGHTATHIKHPIQSFLLSSTTPKEFTVKAWVGHAATQVWHWLHTFIWGGVEPSEITMQDLSALSSLK